MKRFFLILGALTGLLNASTAFAVVLPVAPCVSTQFGCGGRPTDMISKALTLGGNGIASQMLMIAAGLAVVYIIWAGIQMIISMGDEGKITTYKWGIAYALIGLSVSILSQFVISVVGTENVAGGGGNLPQNVLANAARILRSVLNGLFVLMAIVAGLRMIYAQGKADEFGTAKKMMYWAIVGAALVNLSAALVYAVAQFFGVL